jgi:SagB-type dehydrogenase family enzyme
MKKTFFSKDSELIKFHESTKLNKLLPKVKNYPKVWQKVYYKEYPRFPFIKLPEDFSIKKIDLFSTLFKRRSNLNFKNEKVENQSISISKLSKLLFFSAGISDLGKGKEGSRRVYPSAGARYPLEIYPIVLVSSKHLKKGIYHYNVKYHALEFIQNKISKNELKAIGGKANRNLLTQALVILVISAVFGRTEIKYGKRSYRYILQESGHFVQNVYLLATALNFSCCAIGGYVDDRINQLLDLETEKEQVVYLATIGNLLID